jgi:hypothetical protein
VVANGLESHTDKTSASVTMELKKKTPLDEVEGEVVYHVLVNVKKGKAPSILEIWCHDSSQHLDYL